MNWVKVAQLEIFTQVPVLCAGFLRYLQHLILLLKYFVGDE